MNSALTRCLFVCFFAKSNLLLDFKLSVFLILHDLLLNFWNSWPNKKAKIFNFFQMKKATFLNFLKTLLQHPDPQFSPHPYVSHLLIGSIVITNVELTQDNFFLIFFIYLSFLRCRFFIHYRSFSIKPINLFY